MTGAETAQRQQDLRNECVTCCGSHHFGPIVRNGKTAFGQLVCARKEKEQELLDLRKPVEGAKKRLTDLQGTKDADPKAIEEAQAELKVVTEQYQSYQQTHGLAAYAGKPDQFGERDCPILKAWDAVCDGTAPPPDVRAQTDQYLAGLKLTRLNKT